MGSNAKDMNLIPLLGNWLPYSPTVSKMFRKPGKSGVGTAVLFSYLLNRYDWEQQAGRLAPGGWMMLSTGYLEEQTDLSRRDIENARDNLAEALLFETCNIGSPPKTHWRPMPDMANQFATSYKLMCQKLQINLPDVATSNISSNKNSNIEREIREARRNALPFDVPDVDAPPVPAPPPADADPMPAKLAAREAIAAWLEKFPANREDWERRFGKQDWPALIATMVDNYSEATPHALRQDPAGVFRRHVGAWLEVRKNRRPTTAKKIAATKGNPLTYDYTPPAGGNKLF